MRHSQETASKNYLKIFDEEKLTPSQETEKLKKENLKIEHEHQLLKGELLKVKMEEGDKIYNKRKIRRFCEAIRTEPTLCDR